MIKVAIRGLGRVGRGLFRLCAVSSDIRIVAVADVGNAATITHLINFDSTFGKAPFITQVVTGTASDGSDDGEHNHGGPDSDAQYSQGRRNSKYKGVEELLLTNHTDSGTELSDATRGVSQGKTQSLTQGTTQDATKWVNHPKKQKEDHIASTNQDFLNHQGEYKITYTQHPQVPCFKDADIIFDCTGKNYDFPLTVKQKLILSAPSDQADFTIVYGVNHSQLTSSHQIISNASCTTNCLAPILHILEESWGIQAAFASTVHAVTNDQQILDTAHIKDDLLRSRAGPFNIIPTTTGAKKTINKVLPHLEGRVDGSAVRVPVENVSLLELFFNLKHTTQLASIKEAFYNVADPILRSVITTNNLPLVSRDFLGSKFSAVVDTYSMQQVNGLIKLNAWYDNEAAFCHRLIDVAKYVAGHR